MKFLTEYRDPALARRLIRRILSTATRRWVLMEVCGGQTHTIVKQGIDELLEPAIEMIHGPGCPVCVTPLEQIDKALHLASRPEIAEAGDGGTTAQRDRTPGSDRSDRSRRGGDDGSGGDGRDDDQGQAGLPEGRGARLEEGPQVNCCRPRHEESDPDQRRRRRAQYGRPRPEIAQDDPHDEEREWSQQKGR